MRHLNFNLMLSGIPTLPVCDLDPLIADEPTIAPDVTVPVEERDTYDLFTDPQGEYTREHAMAKRAAG